MPLMETSVMLTSVALTVYTGNLAIGVVGGVLLATVLFARRVAHVIRTTRTLSDDGQSVRYEVHGPLFFASSGRSLNEAPPGGVPSFFPLKSLNVLIGLSALVSSANGALL